MFLDARSVPQDQQIDGDVCVIGAGAAGIALAEALHGTRNRVIVLESGGTTGDPETQALYEGTESGLPYFPLKTARLRFLGGSTNHWGGVSRPLDGIDFEARPGIPYTGWPISRPDLASHYPKAAELCGLPNADWAPREWLRRERLPALPFAHSDVVTRLAQVVPQARRSFASRYHDDLAAMTDVEVYLHGNAVELETDEAGAVVTGVRVGTLQGRRFTVRGRVVVLATGGIENPRLLLASNARRPAGLGNQHDNVGRFFLEHPRYAAALVALPHDARLSTALYEPHTLGDLRIQGYLAFPPEVLRRDGLLDVQTRVRPVLAEDYATAESSADVDSLRALTRALRGEGPTGRLRPHVLRVADDLASWQRFTVSGGPVPVPRPDVLVEVLRSPSSADRLLPRTFGDIAATAYRKLGGTAPIEGLVLTARFEPVPNRHSRIRLTRQRDALGMPKVDLHWRLSPADRRAVDRSMELLGAAFASAGIGRLAVLQEAADPGWPEDLAGGWHHMGTTRMSRAPQHGVVDPNCRVHGMENLYIAGSSVFPTASSGTPTLTLVALALRLAAHLARELR